MEHQDNELNDIIDIALGSYSDADPPAALERRILARVRQRNRRWGSKWVYASLAIAAGAMLMMINFRTAERPPTLTPAQKAHAEQPSVRKDEPNSVGTSQPAVVQRPRLAHRPTHRSGDRRALTIPPLTSDERALLLVAQLQTVDVPAFVEREASGIRPLEVHAIEITPLQSDGSQ